MKAVVMLLFVVVAVAVAMSPIPKELCPQIDCPDLNCPFPGYQGMTYDGCLTCTCCSGVRCLMECPHRKQIDSDGCEICRCRGFNELAINTITRN